MNQKPLKLLTQARFIIRRFEKLDMSRVLDIVFLLGRENDVVFFDDTSYTICDLCCHLYSKSDAKNVTIWFEGGPPPTSPLVAQEWYNGTLYNYVIDRIMYAITLSTVREVLRQLKIRLKTDK